MRSLETVLAFGFIVIATTGAEARGGGGANFMDSPGYQRRLQELRGFVTSYSNGYPERGPLYYYRHPKAKAPYRHSR